METNIQMNKDLHSFIQKNNEIHPLRNPIELVINTPMMDVIIKHIKEVIFDYDSGICLLGGHRIGKSTAMYQIVKLLNRDERLPVYCHYLSADKIEVSSVRQMYRAFCYQENIKVKRTADGLEIRDLLIYRLLDCMILSGGKQIVLLIDELQRLNTDQLDALASLHDIFRRIGVNLCIVFVGNTAPSAKLIKATDKEENRLIFGRFFDYQKVIYGIRNKNELEQCLSQFDQLRWPADGPTYTHYFLHEDAPKNWKLASLTNLIWDVYRKEFWPKIKDRHESWGMKYFVSMVRSLLVFYLSDSWTTDTTALRQMISQSIKRSRIVANRVQIVR